jgi:dihydrofolate synthase/folylpolyglutamate synthase
MNFSQAKNYIAQIGKFGKAPGLFVMRELLARAANPDKKLKIIHIAGTNGKGSVSCYITAILNAVGYRVGTFNSPSVFLYNERFLIDGAPARSADIAKYITAAAQIREQMKAEGLAAPTAFEMELCAALLLFADRKCGAVVLETGMGGRYDATNAVDKKELAVITKIALDHTEYLGGTLAQIAAEKAAIAHDCPLVSFEQDKEVMENLGNDAIVAQAPEPLSDGLWGQRFLYGAKEFEIRLLGEHQLQNAALAIETAYVLQKQGFEISDDAIKTGLLRAKIRGRFEIFDAFNPKNEKPITIILDGAHNPDGAKALRGALDNYFGGKKTALIFGAFKDKDYKSSAAALCAPDYFVFTVTPPSARALPAKELAQCVYANCKNATPCSSVKNAFERAFELGAEVVCVCGSFSLLKPADEVVKKLSDNV